MEKAEDKQPGAVGFFLETPIERHEHAGTGRVTSHSQPAGVYGENRELYSGACQVYGDFGCARGAWLRFAPGDHGFVASASRLYLHDATRGPSKG